jgi:diguanylate cyclase (GGDEF)-like protein/PAS domain S-box-containing protein
MPTVIAAFGWASAAGFTLLGLLTLRQWRQERSTKFAILALALGLLALTSWLGRFVAWMGHPSMYATAVEILAFELSGYFLLLFHGSFVTVGRRVRVVAAIAIAVSFALFLTVRMPDAGVIPNLPQAVTISLLVAIWFGCVGEPTVKLWLVSRTRPTVQRARLRALAIGYGAIFIVLVVSAIPGTVSTTEGVQVLLATLGLLVVPLLYMSFAPPRWLRRSWRHSEEETFRRGITELLSFVPDATNLARRSLEWATRLVGADAGMVTAAHSGVIALRNLTAEEASMLLIQIGGIDRSRIVALGGRNAESAVVILLHSEESPGAIILRSGPFTPIFGSDELSQLEGYASLVAMALDRVRQNTRYHSFLQAVSDMGEGLVITEGGRPVYVNDAYAAITGYSVNELMAMPSLLDLAPSDVQGDLRDRLSQRLSGADVPFQYVSQLVRKDGRCVDVESAVRLLDGEGGTKIIGIVRDISERARAQQLRSMQFAVTRTLSESASLDEAAARLLKVIAETLTCEVGRMWLLEPGRDVITAQYTWRDSAVSPSRLAGDSAHLRVARGRGLPGRVWLAGAPLAVADITADPDALQGDVARGLGLRGAACFPVFVDERVTGVIEFLSSGAPDFQDDVVEIMADIGRQIGQYVERRRAEAALTDSMARLAEVASTDPLTGLRNRREYERQLSTIPRRRFAVLAIDVDNLKQTNDEFGHEAGDVLLQAVALTLSSLLRGWDIVARVGGDEFAVLLVDADGADAASAGERMRLAVHAISVPYGRARISVGWAAGPAGADPHAIWRQADVDLYQAKKQGRDRVYGGGGGTEDLVHPSRWAERVEQVLADRRISILYQPIVRLSDGRVVGHEALARPEGCGPSDSVEEFFAEAQRIGRIRDIDWLCRRMAIEGAPWPAPPDWTLFVNVRTLTLLDPVHDVDQMLLLLRAAGGRPEQVVFEITEHEMISDLERLRIVLAAYREHGFRFAVDDVGEGHSTLELLAAANAEFIKIARSLTTTAARSGSRSAIRAAGAFAQSSGAVLLAEGLETSFLVEQMAEFGIALGQGWWLGRPMHITGSAFGQPAVIRTTAPRATSTPAA